MSISSLDNIVHLAISAVCEALRFAKQLQRPEQYPLARSIEELAIVLARSVGPLKIARQRRDKLVSRAEAAVAALAYQWLLAADLEWLAPAGSQVARAQLHALRDYLAGCRNGQPQARALDPTESIPTPENIATPLRRGPLRSTRTPAWQGLERVALRRPERRKPVAESMPADGLVPHVQAASSSMVVAGIQQSAGRETRPLLRRARPTDTS